MGIIDGAIQGITGLIDNAFNANIASQNLAFQKDTFAYQKDLQNKLFEREDNAVQRRAADLEAAGLSKTLAAGSAAGAGEYVPISTPQNKFKSDLSTVVGNMYSTAQTAEDLKTKELQNKILAHDVAIITGNPDTLSTLQKEPLYAIANWVSTNFFGISFDNLPESVRTSLAGVVDKALPGSSKPPVPSATGNNSSSVGAKVSSNDSSTGFLGSLSPEDQKTVVTALVSYAYENPDSELSKLIDAGTIRKKSYPPSSDYMTLHDPDYRFTKGNNGYAGAGFSGGGTSSW